MGAVLLITSKKVQATISVISSKTKTGRCKRIYITMQIDHPSGTPFTYAGFSTYKNARLIVNKAKSNKWLMIPAKGKFGLMMRKHIADTALQTIRIHPQKFELALSA